MLSAEKKRHNSLSDTVYQNLYRKITKGELKPGQKITEPEIAGREGISRAPVREALKRLSEDGLVVLVPRSGCYVCEINREEVDEIFDIRKVLECLALRYAFTQFDLKKINILKKKFQDCQKLDKEKMAIEELKLDSQLHLMIYQASGAKNLYDILTKLHAKIEIFRAKEVLADRTEIALKQHIAILVAILDKDKTRALRLLKEHIETSRKYIVTTME